MRWRSFLSLLLLMVAGIALAADQARIIEATELRSEPFLDAAVVAQLPMGTGVTIQQRKGGWYQVESGRSSGWVRMTSMRLGEQLEGGDSGLGSLFGTVTGRTGSSGVTAVTGIKGIEPEDMLSAVPDRRAVTAMDRFAVSAREADDFAAKGRLSPHQIEYYQGSRGGSHRRDGDEPANKALEGIGSW